LSYLHSFPFDSLKVDRTFTARLAEGKEHRGIVQAVVAIARHLGMSVIAEGVEDSEQLELLRRLGCENVQGYFFSRPLPADAAEGWLDKGAVNLIG
jgi:EAL domain-containing protein (putative c-di-GMP-specific phosphodiesterase class I)